MSNFRIFKLDLNNAGRISIIRVDKIENPKDTALNGIKAFRKFLRSIGMPINFEEIGAKKEDIPTMVSKLGLGKDGRTGGFVHLSSNDIEQIYLNAVKANI